MTNPALFRYRILTTPFCDKEDLDGSGGRAERGARLVLSDGRAVSPSRALAATVAGTQGALILKRRSRRMQTHATTPRKAGASRLIDLEAYHNPWEKW
jgi:hypothetical protein